MKIVLAKEKETPLLMRKLIEVDVDNEKQKTPSETDIKKAIADMLKVKDEVLAIRKIKQQYGTGKSRVIAYIYNNPEALLKLEKANKKQKKKENKEDNKGK